MTSTKLIYRSYKGDIIPESQPGDKSFGYIFNKDDEVLLSTQGDDIWELPGGTIERGGSKEEALFREVYEETAVKTDLDTITLFSCADVLFEDADTLHKREYAFIGRVSSIENFTNDPGGEHFERQFLNLDKFPEVFEWGDSIRSIIPKLKSKLKMI